MIALTLAPTTDTLTGWLVIAILSVGLVAFACAVPAAWEQWRYWRRQVAAWDAEIAADRRDAFREHDDARRAAEMHE